MFTNHFDCVFLGSRSYNLVLKRDLGLKKKLWALRKSFSFYYIAWEFNISFCHYGKFREEKRNCLPQKEFWALKRVRAYKKVFGPKKEFGP